MGEAISCCAESRTENQTGMKQKEETQTTQQTTKEQETEDDNEEGNQVLGKKDLNKKMLNQQCKKYIKLFHDQIFVQKVRPFKDIYQELEPLNQNEEQDIHIIQYKKVFNKLTNSHFMLQEIPKESNNVLFFKKISILNHPNIIHLYEYFETSQVNYIIYDLIEYGDLQTILKKREEAKQVFEEAEVICVAKQMLQVLAYAHDNNYICLNVYPSNILLTKENDLKSGLKLAGFNFSARIVLNKVKNAAYDFTDTIKPPSEYYFPPESRAANHHSLVQKSDVFALATILFQMITGIRCSKINVSADNLIRQCLKNAQPLIQPDFYDLLVKMTKNDPLARITALDALKSPIFTVTPLNQEICNEVIKQFHRFRKVGAVRQFTQSFLIQQYTKKEQREKLNQLFLQFDQDMDGYLGEKDLINIYKNSSRKGIDVQHNNEVQKLLKEQSLQKKKDSNGKHKLELYEFDSMFLTMDQEQFQKASQLCFYSLDFKTGLKRNLSLDRFLKSIHEFGKP